MLARMSASASALGGICAVTVGLVQHQRRTTEQSGESQQHASHNPQSSPHSSDEKARASGISAAPPGVGKETSGGPTMDFTEFAEEVAKKAYGIYKSDGWKVSRSSVSRRILASIFEFSFSPPSLQDPLVHAKVAVRW